MTGVHRLGDPACLTRDRVQKTGERDMSERATHHPPEFRHAADLEWEMGRFGNVTKFLFHPRPERPTEPNAGFLKYAPGA